MTDVCIDCHERPPVKRRRVCGPCNYQRKKAAVAEWKANNPDRVRELARDSRRRRYGPAREEAIAVLGGRCAVCGFDNEIALTFDHVNGGGTAERAAKDRLSWFQAIARGEIHDVQLLCRNCHAVKNFLDLDVHR